MEVELGRHALNTLERVPMQEGEWELELKRERIKIK